MGLTKQQLSMVIVILTGAVLVVLNATMLSPAFPHIMRDTGVDATTVQWLTSGYALVEAVVIPLNAFLVGRFSTRKLFIGGMVWFGIASLVASFAPNFWVILLGRAMMAIATGVIMPMTFTLIVLIIPRENRGAAMGVIGLVISFAPAVGPSLSGVLVDTVGWRVLFALVAGLAVLVVLFAARTLKNFSEFERVPFDVPSVGLLLVGMLCLLYGISSSTSAEILAIPVSLIVVGLVVLGIFARRQLHLETPLLRVEVLKTRQFRAVVIIIALLQASLIGSEVVLPIFVQQVMGQSATMSGLLMLPGALIGAFVGLLAGRLFDKHGVRKLALAGSVLLAIGAIGVTTFSPDHSIFMVTAVYTTVALGIQFLITPLNTWGVNSLDNSVVQHGNALSATLNQVGVSFGTAFIVSLTALAGLFAPADADVQTYTFVGTHVAFIGMCALLLLVSVAILIFVRDTPAEQAQAKHRSVPSGAPAVQVPGENRAWQVADVMNPLSPYIQKGATVKDAIDAMRSSETSGVPIVDEDHAVIGFVSDGDVLKYLSKQTGNYTDGTNYFTMFESEDFLSRLRDLTQLDALRIATKQVITVDAQSDPEDAFKTLSEKRIKKVPVVLEGKLVGCLSRRNIINALARAEELLVVEGR